MIDEYLDFLTTKARAYQPTGFDIPDEWLPSAAKPFQRAIIRWSCRLGRSAIFASTGLGKSLMSLAWANAVVRKTDRPVLLFCPLAVGPQTIREAVKFGVENVHLAAEQADVTGPGIYVTNYQKLHKFDPQTFGGVVLGESSILKNFTGKTRQLLQASFDRTPYRLCETATPAPNDHMEIGQHAEFLGVMRSNEMLSRWFINDQANAGSYRLKSHGKDDFWKWVASWACCVVVPSDLGYEDDGYILPPLDIRHEVVEVDATTDADGRMFRSDSLSATTLHREMRKTAPQRAARAAEIVAGHPNEPVLIWCNTNYEQDELERLIPEALGVRGSMADEKKIDGLMGFTDGRHRVLISKPSVAGHGMNWQHCRTMVFVGLSYSFEAVFQAIRRCWRFGQQHPVTVHMVQAITEGEVATAVRVKEKQFDEMRKAMVAAAKVYWHETGEHLASGCYLGEHKPKFPKWIVPAVKGQPSPAVYQNLFT